MNARFQNNFSRDVAIREWRTKGGQSRRPFRFSLWLARSKVARQVLAKFTKPRVEKARDNNNRREREKKGGCVYIGRWREETDSRMEVAARGIADRGEGGCGRPKVATTREVAVFAVAVVAA